jgi:hypothetical protein
MTEGRLVRATAPSIAALARALDVMPNVSKFNEKRARSAILLAKGGEPLHWIAYGVGVSTRTLKYWLAAGRAGDARYAAWAEQFGEAAEIGRRRKFDLQCAKETEKSKERYQEFKRRRIRWWKDQLGVEGFYLRRLRWLASKGHTAAFARAVLQMRIELALREEVAPTIHDKKGVAPDADAAPDTESGRGPRRERRNCTNVTR